MRKVIDTNYLQRDELRAYLAAAPDNYAVLTDYAAMEAYKGNTLASIFPSLAILADYPKQVIVLKSTSAVCGLTGREAARPDSLIDQIQTREFHAFCQQLRAAERGDSFLREQLLEHGREATANLERWRQDMQKMSLGLEQMMRRCPACA